MKNNKIFLTGQHRLFKPDRLAQGYGVGSPMTIDNEQHFQLYVGTLEVAACSVPALCIADYSNGKFLEMASCHKKYPISKTIFETVDCHSIQNVPGIPLYGIYDREGINSLLAQIKESNCISSELNHFALNLEKESHPSLF